MSLHTPESPPRRESGIPSIDRLLAAPSAIAARARFGHELLVSALREVVCEARAGLAAGGAPELDVTTLAAEAVRRVERWMWLAPRRVFNLTGTVLHTNLGRAPLPQDSLTAVEAAAQACDLEFDLASGRRGERDAGAESWLRRLTGAEAAVVVNNNAAAVLLVLATFATGREVLVSRGELVEIGGSFRLPDVMRRAGCRLREVGTTNRTHAADYDEAVGAKTAMLMKVSTSNYEIKGFTAEVPLSELAAIARRHKCLAYADLGSGALVDLRAFGLPHEPTPREALADGADLVSFSGDKLLGGPQVGIIIGRRELIAKIRRHALLRALRVDKLRLAALTAVLRLYADPATLPERLPTVRLLARPLASIEATAAALLPALAAHFEQRGVAVQTIRCESQVGSGAHPLARLPSAGLRLSPIRPARGPAAAAIARALRLLPMPVVGRVEKDGVVLDLRCLEPADHEAFVAQFAP